MPFQKIKKISARKNSIRSQKNLNSRLSKGRGQVKKFGVPKQYQLQVLKLKIIDSGNSKNLSLVNKIGDKTEFTITRVDCIKFKKLLSQRKPAFKCSLSYFNQQQLSLFKTVKCFDLKSNYTVSSSFNHISNLHIKYKIGYRKEDGSASRTKKSTS